MVRWRECGWKKGREADGGRGGNETVMKEVRESGRKVGRDGARGGR